MTKADVTKYLTETAEIEPILEGRTLLVSQGAYEEIVRDFVVVPQPKRELYVTDDGAVMFMGTPVKWSRDVAAPTWA